MAGESSVLEMAFQNASQAKFKPNTLAALDTGNSGPVATAATVAEAGQQPLGVIYDRARIDSRGNVVSEGMNVRLLGTARIVADSAIPVGAPVGAGSEGRATVADGGPSVGIALTAAYQEGDEVLVLLTPGGGGGGGSNGASAELPFDFKAYKGVVTVGTAGVLHQNFGDAAPDPSHGVQVDNDVTWASQWGKVVDISLRLTNEFSLMNPIPARTVIAHIDGIGIVMGNYEQRIWMNYRDENIGAGADIGGGRLVFPLLLVATNGTDWQAGYDVVTYDPGFTVSADAVLAGNVNLITRTYFKNGEIQADAGDFT